MKHSDQQKPVPFPKLAELAQPVLAKTEAGDSRKMTELVALAQHILDMADDAYLIGHPEWSDALVPEARACLRL